MEETAGKYEKVIASEAPQSSLFHSESWITTPHEVRLVMTHFRAVS
jgi:hypothetical protein